jgi:hypothetical protein
MRPIVSTFAQDFLAQTQSRQTAAETSPNLCSVAGITVPSAVAPGHSNTVGGKLTFDPALPRSVRFEI